MKLSDAEKGMIERLRKREAMMLRWRWPLAIVHGAVVVTAFVLLVALAQFPDDIPDDIPNAKVMLISFMVPPLYLLMACSSMWLGYVMVNWHGNLKTQLLLRLIDERITNAA